MNTPYASASLYVGDLHIDVTEALLFELFNQVGPVASIRVCRDAITRRSLGYAYVNFHNVVDAERALDTMNYTAIKGRACRIMWSHRDPSIRKSGLGNIFIKNLSKSIDNKVLYDTFSQFGNILSCKVATDETGQSKGYGFVHYETHEAADQAMAKVNGMMLGDKIVYVGPFLRKNQRHKDQSEQRFTNVFAKNVPEDWDSDKLKAEFGNHGEITSAVIMVDGEGKSRCFGFVNFEKPEDAKKAVEEFNGKEIGEKTLYVGRAQKKSEREGELRKKFEEMKQERINKYQGVNLFVKNLDDQMEDEPLRAAFAEFGTITSAKVMRDEKAASKGFGFVCFASPEEATKAVTEMNGKMLSGKPVYVALAQRKEVRRAQLEAQHAQRQNGMRMPNAGGMPANAPMYPGAPVFYAQPGMPPQQRQGFVYAQQMAPRPRWPGPQQARPGFQGPMNYMGMPGGMNPRQQRQNRQRGAVPQQQQAGQKVPGQPGAPNNAAQQNRRFKYTANARNQREPVPQGQGQQQMSQSPALPAVAGQEPLTASALAEATPQQQKQMLGERLFPLIESHKPELAGKITGMLLEMDNSELLHLLEVPDALIEKINEAMEVLRAHSQQDKPAAEQPAQAE